MDYRPLEIEDRDRVEKCRNYQLNPFTALTFTSLFTWRKEYGLEIAGDEDYFVIRSRHDNAYFSPCGDKEKCRTFIEQNVKPGESILYLTKEQAEALGDGWEIRKRDDLSEYVCATPALALKEGFHMSHSFKDKCRQYKKRHPYEVRKMTINDLPLIIRIARDWEEADPEGGGDLQALEEEICFYSEITLNGVIVTTENGGHAFIMGYENTPEMFTMTMVKHDLDLPLLMTPVCVHELACALVDKYPYINLEEDLGLEGLRRAKQLFSPIKQLEVYEAVRK